MFTKTAIPIFLSLLLFSVGNGSGKSPLTPPASSPSQDSSGEIELKKITTKQQFSVRAKQLPKSDPPGPFEVWMEDELQVFFKVGNMQQNGKSGQWRLELDANNTAPAALDVLDIAALENRNLQIRDTGGVNIYLAGVVPAPKAVGGDNNNSGPALCGIVALQRPEIDPPDTNATGRIRLRIQGSESEFECEAEHVDTDVTASFSVHIETLAGSNAYFLVGPLSLVSGKTPHWRLEFKNEGTPAPELGVGTLIDLAGRRIQFRDKNDATVLRGIVPAVTTGIGKNNFNERANLTHPAASQPSPKAHGWVRSRYNAPQGASSFEVRAANLADLNTYDVFIETALGSGVFDKAGSLQLKGNKTKSGVFKRETKNGDALPLGVMTLGELTDREIEIRDGNGNVHLNGTSP
ncbi:MAG: hypothetical protein ACKVS6_02615 [Planctomycetota bacterium]